MSSAPLLDVVIPVFNGDKTLNDAVQSVLNQRGIKTRVIVVDAGSTDQTAELMLSMNSKRVITLFTDEKLFAGAARNLGLAHCTAPWLSFLDADDLWPPDRSVRLLQAITEPKSQMAIGESVTFKLSEKDESQIRNRAPCSGNFLIARQTFNKVGQFKESLPVGEFVEWFARARTYGINEVEVSVTALQRRSHALNTSRWRRNAYGTSILKIVKEHRIRNRKK